MKKHEELIAEVNDPNREDQQPGTPAFRLRVLLEQLDERFPMPERESLRSDRTPEQWYLSQLDAALGRLEDYDNSRYFGQ